MKIWYRAKLSQVTVMLINANQEAREFAWCYVARYLTYATLVFSPVVHTRNKHCFLARNFSSSSRIIATTVCGQRAYAEAHHTSCFTEVDAQKSCGWKLRVFVNSSKKKPPPFQHVEPYIFSLSRMIANTPRFSRHDVRYRRVDLKT